MAHYIGSVDDTFIHRLKVEIIFYGHVHPEALFNELQLEAISKGLEKGNSRFIREWFLADMKELQQFCTTIDPEAENPKDLITAKALQQNSTIDRSES